MRDIYTTDVGVSCSLPSQLRIVQIPTRDNFAKRPIIKYVCSMGYCPMNYANVLQTSEKHEVYFNVFQSKCSVTFELAQI